MEPQIGKVIHETKDFAVEIRVGTYADMLFKGLPAYAIVNKRTGVVEAEGRVEADCIRAVHEFQAGLTEAVGDPTGALARLNPSTVKH